MKIGSCLLLGLAMVVPVRAEPFKINTQNCVDFVNAFIESHPAICPGGRCFTSAADFASAVKLAAVSRPRRRIPAFYAKAGAEMTGLYALHALALLCVGGLFSCFYDYQEWRQGVPEPLMLADYVKRFVPIVGGITIALAGSTYGLVKLSRWFDQTPLSCVVATADPYSLCKDVLMDQNVANVLTNEQIGELMKLLSKIK